MQNTDVTAPKGLFGRVGAWLRGDRYMVDAPASPPAAGTGRAQRHDDAADIHDRNADRLDRHGAGSDAARERRDAAVERRSAELERNIESER